MLACGLCGGREEEEGVCVVVLELDGSEANLDLYLSAFLGSWGRSWVGVAGGSALV